jgi:hypothetical protein
MLIWYANNGEETIYFNERMTHYPVLFWGNLLLNFVTPFLILMRNDTKRKFGTMFFVALIVFFGHWWDYFYMIKPGARIAAHEAKELAEGKHAGDSHSSVAPKEEHATPEATAPAEENHEATKPAETSEVAHAEAGHAEASATEHKVDSVTAPTVAEAPAGGAEHTDAETHEAMHPAATEHHDAAEGHGEGEHHDSSKEFKLGYTIPGLEEIGVLIGFLSLFLFFFFNQLSKSSLIPQKDPFLEESLHHETGAMIEGEGGGNSHH